MSDGAPLLADILAIVAAAVGGYLAGSIPVSRLVASGAGPALTVLPSDGTVAVDPAAVRSLAGPGWGLLALAGELARGVLPVAIATVSWSSAAGWVAGVAAVAGACWPALGRLPGGRGVVTLAGVGYAWGPAAATIALGIGVVAWAAARTLRRDGTAASVVAGATTYPFLFVAAQGGPAGLPAILATYAIVAVRGLAAARR